MEKKFKYHILGENSGLVTLSGKYNINFSQTHSIAGEKINSPDKTIIVVSEGHESSGNSFFQENI